MKITSLLLAGGQSQRMGQDKRLLQYQDRPLIRRAFDAAQGVSHEIWVLIADPRDAQLLSPSLGHVRFHVDSHPNSGPLGSLAGALSHLKCDYALLLAADYPLITAQFLQHLKTSLETAAVLPDALVPLWEDMPQVTCAFYRQSLNKQLQEAFVAGERSLRRWAMGLPRDRVTWIPEQEWQAWGHPEVFLSINTPDDYQHLMRLARSPFEK